MVEPGRVCFVNYGEDYGKLVVIIDMLDINRVLIDSVDGSMPRVIYPLKRLTLTKILMAKAQKGCRTGTLKKLNKGQNVVEEFKKTSAAIKMAKYEQRKNLTDFERFKVMVLRKQRSWTAARLSTLNKKKAPPPKKEVPPSPTGGKKKVQKQKSKKAS